MGLTESNHSKATTGCTGPSKSRSTPHFPDSRGYHGRPRQAATLPARPTPDSSQTPPYHQSRMPVHDPHALGHDPRPPEREPSYRDSYVQVGRSPSFRPGVPRRSASADSRKRRSDPLLDAKTLKQIPGMVAFHHGPHQVSLPQPTGSPPTSPRSSAQRPRPTAIYVADDEPTHVVRMREGRSRDRESMGRQSRDRESLGRQSRDRESMGRQSRDRESMGRHSRNGQRTESRERSRGSRDRKQRTTHVSTFTMTPHCPDSTHTAPGNGAQPSSYQKHRKTRHKSGQRAEYTVPDNPQSDPYVCLHYGGTMKNGQKKPVQQVTAWRTDYSEEAPSSPNHQMSQVVIHMNQVTATTLDNYDAVNANIESVQVRRNVWFQASRAVGSVNEPPIRRKISSKAIRTPSIYETTSGYQNSDIIRYPDVTNKVSSIYMRPDLLHNKESDTIYSSTASSSIGQRRDLISSEPSSHRYPYNHSHRGNAVASMYEVSYSKEPNSEEKISHDPPLQLDVTDEIGLGGCYRSHEKCELENPSATDFNGRRDIEVSGLNDGLPSLELPGPSYKQPSTNGDLNYGTMIDEEENTRYSHRNVKGMELNFGINNHIEDYTIIEDATNHGPFYGCRDSDYENDDSCSTASRNFLSGLEPRSSQCNQDMPAECSFTLDKECLSSDKADKEPSTGDINQVVDYSQFALSDSTERRALKEKALSCDSPLNKTENRKELDDFYKKQYSLVADYLSLKDNVPLLKSEDKKSDLNGSISDHPGRSCSSDTVPLLLDSDLNGSFSDHPGRSYNSDTVPGSPSASAFSQKCLTQSSSLPRHLRCVSRSATLDSGNTDMKAFRNRFRSFDLGHFPVLRLPLGNQPRLVDVLRASSTHLEEKENNEELEGRASEESLDNTCDIAESVDVASNDVENPSVSYPECLETQEKEEEEEEENDDDGEVHVGSDAVSCVPCDSSENPSQNSPDIDEIRPESSPVAEQLPNELPDSQEEEKEEHHTDEGCDIGTIKKGALLRNLADTNSSPELFLPLNKASQGSLRQGMVGGPPVAVGVSSNTWHSNGSHVGSTRKWSNDGMQDGSGHRHPHRHVLLDGSVTLRHPNLKANESRKDVVDKRRALSDASSLLHLKPSAGDAPPTGEVPDIIPPFNKQVRRKHPNRRSIHSIDWDTPLPPVPQNDQKDCSYTCHEQCQDLVTLDCKADLTPDSHTSEEDLYVDSDSGTLVKHELLPCLQTPSVTVTSQDEDEEELEVEEEVEEEDEDQEEQEEKHEEEQQEKDLLEEPRKNEEISTLRRKINRLQSHLVDNETLEDWVEKYNATTQGVKIAKENDGSYRGCIRVHLNLCRPINIVAGTRPPSIYDILQEDRTMEKTLTSFYMPRDAVKAIHITNKTTTREVIIALLRKFKVVDNPQKFALYERTHDTGQPGKAKLRRLGDSECPLVLAINWSAEGLTNKRLVLQENDTADIQWEAFSLPELSNFLRILDREEEEYRCQIKDKYALLRRRVGNILLQNAPAE